jgi:hypothetical protein
MIFNFNPFTKLEEVEEEAVVAEMLLAGAKFLGDSFYVEQELKQQQQQLPQQL